jgi:hypothetical protein
MLCSVNDKESKRQKEYLKRTRPDVVHTRPDGALPDWQSAGPRVSGHRSRSVRTLHTENLKLEENLQKKYFL